MRNRKKTVIICFSCGCLLLVLGLVAAFTVGTLFVPIAIFSSILLNSAGIVLLRLKGGDDPK